MTAGRLNKRVRFERRSANSGGAGGDAYGRAGGGWTPRFAGARWAGVEGKTGRETTESRVQGRQTWEVLVRRDPETITVTTADRVVTLAEDLSPALYLNVKAVAPFPPDPDAFLLLTCEAGGANG